MGIDGGPEANRRAANVPIVADIHFHYNERWKPRIRTACLRINPATSLGREVREVINAPRPMAGAIRSGSMPAASKGFARKIREPCPEALVESALDHIRLLMSMTSTI